MLVLMCHFLDKTGLFGKVKPEMYNFLKILYELT